MINKGSAQWFYMDLKAKIKFILQIESRLYISESESHSVLSDSLRPPGLYSPWNSQGQNTGVGSLSLLQGIFPTQGSNPGLQHCRQILYRLSYKGSLRILEWVAYPFSSGSSWPGNWTRVSCVAGRFFTNWAIREAQLYISTWTFNSKVQKAHYLKNRYEFHKNSFSKNICPLLFVNVHLFALCS